MPVTTSFPSAVGLSVMRRNLVAPSLGVNRVMSTLSSKVSDAVTKGRSSVVPPVTAFWLTLAVMKAVPQTLFWPLIASVSVKVMTPPLTVATATTLPAASKRSKVNAGGRLSCGGRVRVKKSPPTEPFGTHQSVSKSTVPNIDVLVVVTSTSVIASVISAALAGVDRPRKSARKSASAEIAFGARRVVFP